MAVGSKDIANLSMDMSELVEDTVDEDSFETRNGEMGGTAVESDSAEIEDHGMLEEEEEEEEQAVNTRFLAIKS